MCSLSVGSNNGTLCLAAASFDDLTNREREPCVCVCNIDERLMKFAGNWLFNIICSDSPRRCFIVSVANDYLA